MDMQIYIFKSESSAELRAFAGDLSGSKLPEQFRPWHAVGVVGEEKEPPHGLSRDTIELAIDTRGYQLWRMRPKTDRQPA
jgi:hypothetical protein